MYGGIQMFSVQPTTKKKGTIAAIVICSTIGFLFVTVSLLSRPEPTCAGKPVRYWARQSRHAVEDDSLRTLIQMGAAAVPCLTNQLSLKDGLFKKSWLWIWPKLPPVIKTRFAQPIKASDLRAAAAWDLLHLGPAAKEAVPSLIAALKDDDLFVRLNAAASFGHIGPDAAPAIPAFIEALKDRERGVRFNAAYSLSLLGPLARDAIPALKTALDDPDPDVRTKVKEALQKIDPGAAISAR